MANLQNPVKAIRAKCLDCCVQQINEVRDCPAQDCPLWPFRLGKNPYRHKVARSYTPEQIEELRQRMRHCNELQKQRKLEEAQDE